MKNPRNKIHSVQFAILLLIPTFGFVGCNQSNPGNWDQATVQSKLQEKMKLESLELVPASGGLSGSGTDAEGQTYKITVTQDAAAKELSYVAEGDRGATEEGSIAGGY